MLTIRLLIGHCVLCFLCVSTEASYEVVYAVNAGGEIHRDRNGIMYERDPLMDRIGVASDYGKQLMMIGRVQKTDEILYQTERYHTSTFGYDMPVSGDGEYALVLKFCEVYFNAPNMKVFDVRLNGDHTVIADLDIFQQVGKGVAHEEYVHFTVSRGRLFYKEEESEVRGGRVRIEFVKGYRDNPKINALILIKGDVKTLPKLTPIEPGAPDSVQHILDTDDDLQEFAEKLNLKPRKPSGPKMSDPYALDDSSVMLPVFIAIGAFIPLLFCLCKL